MAQGEGGGRPPVTFDEKQIVECEALAAVLSKSQIADYFGIHEDTLRAVEGRQPEVSRALKRGKAKAIATVSRGALTRAIDGNDRMTEFYLSTQAGWNKTQIIEADLETHVTLQLDGKTIDGADLGW